MQRVTMMVLIGLAALGAVYAGTSTEELTREQKNTILVEMAIGAMNDGDWALMAGLYSPGFVQHSPGDVKSTTWAEHELAGRTIKQKIPTARFDIMDIVAEGDKVAVRGKTVVTYKKSDYRGGTKTVRIEFAEMDLFRIKDYKIVEEWCEYDTADWKIKMRTLKNVKTWR